MKSNFSFSRLITGVSVVVAVSILSYLSIIPFKEISNELKEIKSTLFQLSELVDDIKNKQSMRIYNVKTPSVRIEAGAVWDVEDTSTDPEVIKQANQQISKSTKR